MGYDELSEWSLAAHKYALAAINIESLKRMYLQMFRNVMSNCSF